MKIKSLEPDVKIYEPSLKAIKPVLKKWIEIVTEYSDSLDDICYGYNERASISILSGAAWQTPGWLALEEFSTYKHGKEKGNQKYGRCDLFLTTSDKKSSFAIEAKQVWQSIGDRADSRFSKSEKIFKDAEKDSRHLIKYDNEMRLGVCFISPIMPLSLLTESKSFDHRLLEWIQLINDKLKPDAIAWCFPESTREQEIIDGKIFPGVCMVIKLCKRGRRIPSEKLMHEKIKIK